jgi:hypothetical protein
VSVHDIDAEYFQGVLPYSSEQLFSDQWKSAVSSCYDALERQDWRHVNFFNSWDDVQKQILKTQDDPLHQTTHQEFAILTPSLLQLRTFTDFFSQHLVPKHDTSVFWGIVGLIIKVYNLSI